MKKISKITGRLGDRKIIWEKRRKNVEQWAVFDFTTKKVDFFEMKDNESQPSDGLMDFTKKDFQRILKKLNKVV